MKDRENLPPARGSVGRPAKSECPAGRSDESPCALCGTAARRAAISHSRDFYHCRHCDLIFVPTHQHIDEPAQRERYLKHHNTQDNAGYVDMLEQPIALLREHDPSAKRVLDYGCGPNPVLVDLLRRAGYDAVGYDPFFAPDADLSQPFDAVISVETFEHFANPRADLRRIASLLRPGGHLIITTLFHHGPTGIPDWWYARDKTHVSFYSPVTMRWICEHFSFTTVSCDEESVAMLRSER